MSLYAISDLHLALNGEKPMGIFGSTNEFFCFDCKHISMQVVKEFEEPAANLIIFLERIGTVEKRLASPIYCPRCKSKNLFSIHELGDESEDNLKPCKICGTPLSIKHLFTT